MSSNLSFQLKLPSHLKTWQWRRVENDLLPSSLTWLQKCLSPWPCGPLYRAAYGMAAGILQRGQSKREHPEQKPLSFYNLVSEVTSPPCHHICIILVNRSKSLPHSRGKSDKVLEGRGRSLRGPLKDHLSLFLFLLLWETDMKKHV